jgi:hypothetical protein
MVDSGVSDDGPDDLSTEQIWVLRHRFRRRLIRQLIEAGGRGRLVPLLLAMEDEFEAPLRKLMTCAYDVHVPKLAECGLIAYDEEVGQIELVVGHDTAEAAIDRSKP